MADNQKLKKIKPKREYAKRVDFTDQHVLLRIQQWAQEGLDEGEIIRQLGYRTVGRLSILKKKYPAIQDAIRKGRAPLIPLVRQAAFKLAIGGYSHDTVTHQYKYDDNGNEILVGKTVVTQNLPPQAMAIQNWLRAYDPNFQAEKIDITSKGEKIENQQPLIFLSSTELSPAQRTKYIEQEIGSPDDNCSR